MSKELLQQALDALNSGNFPERTAAVRVLESALERQKQPEQLAVSNAEAKAVIDACYMFHSPDLVRDMQRALEAFAASRAMPATQGAPAASQAAITTEGSQDDSQACNDCPFRETSTATYCADALAALDDAHEPACHKLVGHDAIFNDPTPGKKHVWVFGGG